MAISLECLSRTDPGVVLMSPSAVVTLVVLFLVAAYAVVLYNGLVRLKHGVGKAWSNIDVLMRQRHEELPKLVETCKQYMQHERGTLEAVIQARNAVSSARQQGDVGALGQAETGLRAGLGRLFALAENYPELRANDSFRHLQQRSEEHTSELQSRENLVCRLLLEKKKQRQPGIQLGTTKVGTHRIRT